MQDQPNQRFSRSLAVFIALVFVFTAGVMADRAGLVTPGLFNASASNSTINTGLINEAWNIIQRSYADRAAIAVPTLPVVVQINNGTASAAEIVSEALQDAGQARLVGETTFGTRTVLNEFRLSDGSALLLATEQWLTPKGRVIWHNGITPDIEVALPEDATPLIPETERGMTAAQVTASDDSQLLRAMEVLQNH